MKITYVNLSREAAACERKGKFSEAAHLWNQANKTAGGVNVAWSELRAEFCAGMARRGFNAVPDEPATDTRSP